MKVQTAFIQVLLLLLVTCCQTTAVSSLGHAPEKEGSRIVFAGIIRPGQETRRDVVDFLHALSCELPDVQPFIVTSGDRPALQLDEFLGDATGDGQMKERECSEIIFRWDEMDGESLAGEDGLTTLRTWIKEYLSIDENTLLLVSGMESENFPTVQEILLQIEESGSSTPFVLRGRESEEHNVMEKEGQPSLLRSLQITTDEPTSSPTNLATIRPEEPWHCGCSECTNSIWYRLADTIPCGNRIAFLQYNDAIQFPDEESACRRVAGVEFPSVCGYQCDPDRCDGRSVAPSTFPSSSPSHEPSAVTSAMPSLMPSSSPTEVESRSPSLGPSAMPSELSSDVPSIAPSSAPTQVPTIVASTMPSFTPSAFPTKVESRVPSLGPSSMPSDLSSDVPSVAPSTVSSQVPSVVSSGSPSMMPSVGASISGCVTLDIDNNDVGEEPVPDALIILWWPTVGSNEIDRTETDSNGCYSFEGLSAGHYGVQEVNPVNLVDVFPIGPPTYKLQLDAGEEVDNVDFIDEPLRKIAGQVQLTLTDPPSEGQNIEGILVRLISDGVCGVGGNVTIETFVTNSLGFAFDVLPGIYEIQEVPSGAYVDVGDSDGGDPNSICVDVSEGDSLGNRFFNRYLDTPRPTPEPSSAPSKVESFSPSNSPSFIPSGSPSAASSTVPSASPSAIPTPSPVTVLPLATASPTASPSSSFAPTSPPSKAPSASSSPSLSASVEPSVSQVPSKSPSDTPSMWPTAGASIIGCVTLDIDNDDVGDEPVPGALISLSIGFSEIAVSLTGSDGCYIFEGLAPGSYIVREVNPFGQEDVAPIPPLYDIDLSPGEERDGIDFVNEPMRKIAGKVLLVITDQMTGGTAIPNITVNLISGGVCGNGTNSIIDTMETDFNGCFEFTELPGIYELQEVATGFYEDVGDSDGGDPNSICVNTTGEDVLENRFFNKLFETARPTLQPTTGPPSFVPSVLPSAFPSNEPSDVPTSSPSLNPSDASSSNPSLSLTPSMTPSITLSTEPSVSPSSSVVPTISNGSPPGPTPSPPPDTPSLPLVTTEPSISMLPSETHIPSIQTLIPTAEPEKPWHCGCLECTNSIFYADTGSGWTCADRIYHLIFSNRSYYEGEIAACRVVAGEMHAVECGPECDPNRCTHDDGSPSGTSPPHPPTTSPPSKSPIQQLYPQTMPPTQSVIGSVRGCVFSDEDNDGDKDQGIADATLKLLLNGTLVSMTTTNSEGCYAFLDLGYGSYEVEQINDDGFADVTDSIVDVEVDGDIIGVDFIDEPLRLIQGKVVELMDSGNGTGLDGDPIENSEIILAVLDAEGNTELNYSTSTDSEGSFSFSRVYPGIYELFQINLDGYVDVIDSDGDDPAMILVNVSSSDSKNNTFVDELSSEAPTAVPPSAALGQISGCVREFPFAIRIPDAPIELFDQGTATTIDSTFTSSDGCYNFTDVPAGEYTVIQGELDGYDKNPDEERIDVSLAEGEHSFNNDFVYVKSSNDLLTAVPDTPTPTSYPTQGPTGFPSSPSTTIPLVPDPGQTDAPTSLGGKPTFNPKPIAKPTLPPSLFPLPPPSKPPTAPPTNAPSAHPTRLPTKQPTKPPTSAPTKPPTKPPTSAPTKLPTKTPTLHPTRKPSAAPTKQPTKNPTKHPTKHPTPNPSAGPTKGPTKHPTLKPSSAPTPHPITTKPTKPTKPPKPSKPSKPNKPTPLTRNAEPDFDFDFGKGMGMMGMMGMGMGMMKGSFDGIGTHSSRDMMMRKLKENRRGRRQASIGFHSRRQPRWNPLAY